GLRSRTPQEWRHTRRRLSHDCVASVRGCQPSLDAMGLAVASHRALCGGEAPQETRRIAGVDARFREVPGDDGTRPNHDVITDRYGEDGRVRAHAHVIPEPRRAPAVTALLGTTVLEEVIDEHRPVRDETVVPDGHELADEGVGLDAAAPSYHDVP